MFFTQNLQMDGTFGAIAEGMGIDWNAIINQGFALGSQMVNSWGGAHTGTQVGYNPSQGGVFAIQAQPAYDDSYRYAVPAGNGQVQGGSVGNTVGSGLDGILSFVMTPIGLIVVGGAVLLFMRPPGRR